MTTLAGSAKHTVLAQGMSTFLWKNRIRYICYGKAPPHSKRKVAEEMKA